MIQATRKSVCAIIPAFGEARFIGTVVCGILEHLDRVIVVDDYSPDRTTTVAREAGAEVIRHSENVTVRSISLQFDLSVVCYKGGCIRKWDCSR